MSAILPPFAIFNFYENLPSTKFLKTLTKKRFHVSKTSIMWQKIIEQKKTYFQRKLLNNKPC